MTTSCGEIVSRGRSYSLPGNVFEKAQVKSYYKSPRRTAPFCSTQEAGMDPLKSIGSLDPARRALSLLEEFKNFALKGNVIDLAVGVIIGAAFGKIVDSLLAEIRDLLKAR
jgi:hypothetical protein